MVTRPFSPRPSYDHPQQAATSGPLSAVWGGNRITWRSPPAHPPARTSWPRTLPGAAPRGDGVQLSWRPVVFKVEQLVIAGSLPRAAGLQQAVLAGDRREDERRTDDEQPHSHLREKRAAGGDEGESRGQQHDDSVEWDAVDVHLASSTLVWLWPRGRSRRRPRRPARRRSARRSS